MSRMVFMAALAAYVMILWDPGFDTSPRFSPLFRKSLQHRHGFEGHDCESAVVARL